MVACVVCAEGECSPDCIFVDVFPVDKEESKINAEKVLSGWHVNYVKELLMQAKVRGGVDLMKALVHNWIGKYQITRYYKRNKAQEDAKRAQENAKTADENARREKKRMLEKRVADVLKQTEAAEKKLASQKRKFEYNNDLLARRITYLQIQRAVYDHLTNPVAPASGSSSGSVSGSGSGSSSADRIKCIVYDQLAKHAAASSSSSAPALANINDGDLN